MNKFMPPVMFAACAALAAFAPKANARDTVIRLSIADAMATADAKAMLHPNMKFVFGDAPAPAVANNFGSVSTSKKTNGFSRDAKVACQRAFLSAMITLQEHAQRQGGDAVINISSNYRRKLVSSSTEFECGTGALMVGVAFQGNAVKTKEKK
jgi:uncharacterized protein YbjQ (UPF0145 family)